MPARAPKSKDYKYGIVLDAGSSGTRLHIYRWLDSSAARKTASTQQLHSLPHIETKKKWTEKTKPGISTFGPKPARVGPDHLKELFEKAQKIIPKHNVADTPLFLLATAGMRLLPDNQRAALLGEICSYAQTKTDFLLPDCDLHIQVIPGDTEGLYGWIAANYLLGGFDPPSATEAKIANHRTFGFLDMGGASAQIAFAPNATEAERHADDLTLLRLRTIDGVPVEYRVFTTTWLGFGVNEARRRYVETLQPGSESSKTKDLLDPCLPPGLSITPKGDIFLPDNKKVDGKTPIIQGTGNFTQCLDKTLPLLDKDHICADDPCLIGGVHVPAIDFDVNHFVGVSEYWHTTHEIFQIGEKDKAYDFNTYQDRVSKFCTQDWDEIEKGIKKHEWGDKVDEKTAVEVCFKASWLINILHEGIGIPRIGLEETPDNQGNGSSKLLDGAKDKGLAPAFRPINKIDDTEVSWTLGKILLYAASKVPASQGETEILPVGFGSNVKDVIPSDFHYPGGSISHLHQPTINTTTPISAEQTIPSATSLRTAAPRRIPGIILFLLILCLATYLLIGRSRRQRLILNFNPGSSSSSLPSKNGASSSTSRSSILQSKFSNLFRPLSTSSPSSALGIYERVPTDLEDGPLSAPDAFELSRLGHDIPGDAYENDEEDDDYTKSQSSSSSSSKTSGRASTIPSTTNMTTRLDNVGLGLGLGPSGTVSGPTTMNPMNRSGLVGRTDSRERLHLGTTDSRHSRSRRSSPSKDRDRDRDRERGKRTKSVLGRVAED